MNGQNSSLICSDCGISNDQTPLIRLNVITWFNDFSDHSASRTVFCLDGQGAIKEYPINYQPVGALADQDPGIAIGSSRGCSFLEEEILNGERIAGIRVFGKQAGIAILVRSEREAAQDMIIAFKGGQEIILNAAECRRSLDAAISICSIGIERGRNRLILQLADKADEAYVFTCPGDITGKFCRCQLSKEGPADAGNRLIQILKMAGIGNGKILARIGFKQAVCRCGNKSRLSSVAFHGIGSYRNIFSWKESS